MRDIAQPDRAAVEIHDREVVEKPLGAVGRERPHAVAGALRELGGDRRDDDGEASAVADRAHTEAPRDAHRELELVVVGEVAGREAQRDGEVAAARLLELAHHVRAGLGRRLPVNVATLVTRLVLAERVEGEVVRGEVSRGDALQVVDESGARAGCGNRHRMHDEGLLIAPDELAPNHSHRIGAHRAHRAERDHAAPARRQRHLVRVLGAAAQTRDRQLHEPLGNRHFNGGRQAALPARIARDQAQDGGLAGDDAVMRQVEFDRDARSPDQVDDRDQGECDDRPADGDELDPPEDVAEDEHDRRPEEQSPAQRSHHGGGVAEPAPGRPSHGAEEPDGEHHRVGKDTRPGSDDPRAGVLEGVRVARVRRPPGL